MMGMMNNGWMMGGMGLLNILFWILIIAGAVLIVQWLSGRGKVNFLTPLTESPLEILKKRYAKGEIDKAVFERMKKDLGEGEGS